MRKQIIDVRTPEEFFAGHVEGSLNIPLQDIPYQVQKIKQLGQPLVLCCATGNRSGQAAVFLKNQGIACENGGSWLDLRYQMN